jgi:hypothetical protein
MTQTPATPAPQQPPQGTIRLTIQGNELTAGLLTPAVVVSGHRVNSRFGTMDVPVWAGPNRVEVSTRWMREYGQASLDVVVRPGEVVPVFYAVPWHQFSSGSIGHRKQPRKGLAAVFLGTVAFVVIAVLIVLASL